MASLEIRQYPDEILRQPAKKVTKFDANLRKFVQDMFDTMYAADGVGLAAPQVGVSKQIFVIDIANEDEPKKPMVFINPKILQSSGEMVGLEGCLSFPGVFFEVKRFENITVKFQNINGQDKKMDVKGGLLSRAIQHENDHLLGSLFIDKPVSKLACDLELTKSGFLEGDLPESESCGSESCGSGSCGSGSCKSTQEPISVISPCENELVNA